MSVVVVLLALVLVHLVVQLVSFYSLDLLAFLDVAFVVSLEEKKEGSREQERRMSCLGSVNQR